MHAVHDESDGQIELENKWISQWDLNEVPEIKLLCC